MRCSFIWLESWKEGPFFRVMFLVCFSEAMFHCKILLIGAGTTGGKFWRAEWWYQRYFAFGAVVWWIAKQNSSTGQQCTETKGTVLLWCYHTSCFSKGILAVLGWKSLNWGTIKLHSNYGILQVPVFSKVPHEQLYLIVPGEVLRRKRSKSEDMDNVHSKRRRYLEEGYEAELQVKITARKDVDQKLQKVEWRCRAKMENMHLSFVITIFELVIPSHALPDSQTLHLFCGWKLDVIHITKMAWLKSCIALLLRRDEISFENCAGRVIFEMC